MWALEGANIGQKEGGRLIKILPARQTHFGSSLASPSGKIHFRGNAAKQKICHFREHKNIMFFQRDLLLV